MCSALGFIYSVYSVESPFCQLQGQSSSVWSASRTLRTSFVLRPTFRSVTMTNRVMPSGSTMNVARCATPSVGSRIPSAWLRSRLMSESMGKGRSFSSALCCFHARCTNSESVLTPSSWVSRSLNSECKAPNSAISVGQTKVKSLGQKKIASHFLA